METAANSAPTTLAEPRSITAEAPWRWLAAGWKDLWRNPLISLGYGAVFVFLGLGLVAVLYSMGLSSMIPVFAGAFAIVGPLMAVGLYKMSRCYERGQPVKLSEILILRASSPLQFAYIGFIIFFGFLVWTRIAVLLYALFVSGTYLPLSKFSEFVLSTPQGLAMMVIGAVIGAGIAFVIFSLTAMSVPMILDRRVDALSAVLSSVKTVIKNPRPMILWAWLVGVFVAVGIATFFVGLIVIFPLLGHATWHAYREVFGKGS